ncbi:MAG: methionyl-tRNA formyltransferase [Akkermansia sp.]
MRIVFMGTGNIALPSFQRLLHKEEVVGLVTQPDRPVGRHQLMTPPALKVLAENAGIPVLQPESLRKEQAIRELAALAPELIVVMAYGQILSEEVIQMAPHGCINAHASLLPRHRGASCIPAAIRAGDSATGITIMHVVKRLDAGDIIKSAAFPLMGRETAGMVHDALANLAPDVLMDAIHAIASGAPVRIRQNEALVTYAHKLSRADGLINWSLPAHEIERAIRAYDPWPGTSTAFIDKKGRRRNLKVFAPCKVREDLSGNSGEVIAINERGLLVACGQGALLIATVQPEGSRRMSVAHFAPGRLLEKGMILEPLEQIQNIAS